MNTFDELVWFFSDMPYVVVALVVAVPCVLQRRIRWLRVIGAAILLYWPAYFLWVAILALLGMPVPVPAPFQAIYLFGPPLVVAGYISVLGPRGLARHAKRLFGAGKA